ncbi:uncharacterized protein LOC126609015 [Malus sylvestris]|uniref:uncharacterized protein LOC126609015 n=1 Tax=Malus sylvestris TaxID=3752 RepID=UPI0021AC9C8B|nr:uncharacterized protein LOC126609015 [Malus sylvestris]
MEVLEGDARRGEDEGARLFVVNRLFVERYKQWKSDLHQYFQTFDDPQVTLEEGCPKEFKDREKIGYGSVVIFRSLTMWRKPTRSIGRRRLFSTIRVRGPSHIGWKRGGKGVQNSRMPMSLQTFMFDTGMSWPSPFMRR